MKAHSASLINAAFLITMSLWGYCSSDNPSATALIPTFVGIVLLLLNKGVKNENKMIAHIEGILESKLPNQVVIDVNGIGYLLHISLNTFEDLPSKGKLRLFSHLIVREDAHLLFGFAEEKERTMFKELINVSGVGANTALMILSSMKPDDVVLAVDQSNVEAFKII